MIRYPGTILPIVPGPGERVLPGWWDGVGGGNTGIMWGYLTPSSHYYEKTK